MNVSVISGNVGVFLRLPSVCEEDGAGSPFWLTGACRVPLKQHDCLDLLCPASPPDLQPHEALDHTFPGTALPGAPKW